MNKTLWHKTKGDVDDIKHEDNGEQVETSSDLGGCQTGDT